MKPASCILGLVVLALAAIFGVNQTDEELSELAKEAMAVLPVAAPSPANGYADLIGLQGAVVDERLRRSCSPDEGRCLKYAAENPDLVKLSASVDDFMARYRAMRAKQEFADLYQPASPEDVVPPFQHLFWGQGRSQLLAADMANQGRVEAAIAELEAENAFHRRIAAGSRHLLTKMVAFALLSRDAVFASDLARIPGRRTAALLGRLKATVRPLTEAEMDVRHAFLIDRADTISWMRSRRHVRVPEDVYKLQNDLGMAGSRPWWDAVAPFLYRPHQTVNLYAAQSEILIRVATVKATQFAAAAQAARAEALAQAPGGLASMLVNPVGRNHPYIKAIPGVSGQPDAYTPYIGRAHSTQALNSLVSLQIALRQAGITKPAAVERALDGPLFQSHPDPFTGKPMRFDAGTRTIGFEAPEHSGGALIALEKRYGRVAVELMVDP